MNTERKHNAIMTFVPFSTAMGPVSRLHFRINLRPPLPAPKKYRLLPPRVHLPMTCDTVAIS